MLIVNPPTQQKNRHSAFKNIQTKNREKGIQPPPLESKWMSVASPSKENRHRAFIVKKGPPPPNSRRSTVSRAGSWRVFRYDGIFYSMIFGGEMSKIGHGVGRFTVAIFGGCAMWRFFFAVAREQRAKNPTSSQLFYKSFLFV